MHNGWACHVFSTVEKLSKSIQPYSIFYPALRYTCQPSLYLRIKRLVPSMYLYQKIINYTEDTSNNQNVLYKYQLLRELLNNWSKIFINNYRFINNYIHNYTVYSQLHNIFTIPQWINNYTPCLQFTHSIPNYTIHSQFHTMFTITPYSQLCTLFTIAYNVHNYTPHSQLHSIFTITHCIHNYTPYSQ